MTDTYDKKPQAKGGESAKEPEPLKIEISATLERPSLSGASPENSATDAPGAVSFFTPIDAFSAFSPAFLDEADCRMWVILRLHPRGAHCPECGLCLENSAGFYQGKRVACGRCGHMFTATSNTFLQGSHLDYRQAFLLAVLVDLLQNGINAQRVSEVLGVSADTVRIWIKRFKALGE